MRREAGLVAQARRRGARLILVEDRVMAALSGTRTPQGILATVRQPVARLTDVLATRPRLLLLCAGVADPGNAGALLRVADAAGAGGVLFTAGSVDPYGDKCVRASAGSVLHLPVVTDLDIVAAAEALTAAGLQLLAADAAGECDLFALGADLAAPTVWVVGGEAHGLPTGLPTTARRVRVPIHGRAESLNVATAAAVCLYASAQAQRR